MNLVQRTLLSAALAALVAVASVPTAQATSGSPLPSPCTYDPEAWINYCPTTRYQSVPAYQPTVNPQYERICPVSGTCVDLLKPSSVGVQQVVVVVPTPWVDVTVNGEQIVNDVCGYLDLYCCIWYCWCCCCPDPALTAEVVDAACEGREDCAGVAGFVRAEDGTLVQGVVVTLEGVTYFLPYHAAA